jgi:hypothetical protein
MSRVALLLALPLVFACTKKDEPAPVDSTAAVAAAPAPASHVGKWAVNVMPQDKDTVVASYVLETTDSQDGWKLTFPNAEPLDVRVITMNGDSIVTDVGPFPSQVRKGEKVNVVRSTWRVNGDKLSGLATVHYDRKAADSVSVLRLEGTRQ